MAFKIKSEIIPGSEPKRFREGGRLHHNIRIFLISDNKNDLDKVESVQYELHPTFRDRYRVSTDRVRNFSIMLWTYGFFKIQAKVIMKDGRVDTVDGFVRW